jgi:hypothetical protein
MKNKLFEQENFEDPVKPQEFKIAITTLIAFSRSSTTLKTQMVSLIREMRKQMAKYSDNEKLKNLTNEAMVFYYKLDVYSKLCEDYYKTSKESDLFADVSNELFDSITDKSNQLTDFVNKARKYMIQFPAKTKTFEFVYGKEITEIANRFKKINDPTKKTEAVMYFIEDFRTTIKKDIPQYKERLTTILRQVTGKEETPAEESDDAEAAFSDKDFAVFLEKAKGPVKTILGKPEMFVKEDSKISVKKEYESFVVEKIAAYDFPGIQVIYDMIIKIQEQNLSKKQLFDAFQEKFSENPGQILGGVLRFLQATAEEKTKIKQDTESSQQNLVRTLKRKGINYLKSFEIGVPLFIDEGGDLNTELVLNSVYSDPRNDRPKVAFDAAKELLTVLKSDNDREFQAKYGNYTKEEAVKKLSALSALVKERNTEIARDINNVWSGYGLGVKGEPSQATGRRNRKKISSDNKTKLKKIIKSMASYYKKILGKNPKGFLEDDEYKAFLKNFKMVIEITREEGDTELTTNNAREISNLNNIQEQIVKLIKPYLHERIKSKRIGATK